MGEDSEEVRLRKLYGMPEEERLALAMEQFKSVADGRYTLLELLKTSPELAMAATAIATHFGKEMKPPSTKTIFRGESGDTVLERSTATPYRETPQSYSGNLVFIVQGGEVVEVGEDTTEQPEP
jgi:hypothetical protein